MYSELNKQIAIDINSISDASNRYLVNQFSIDTQRSIHTIQDYINNTLYPILKTLTSSPNYVDVIDTGLSGETIISYLNASESNGPIFWDVNYNRAKTIKESLSYIQSIAIGNQTILNTIVNSELGDRVAILETVKDNQQETITDLELNLLQVSKDCFGDAYSLNNDGNKTLETPLSELFIMSSSKGAINGVATLDSNGKVPISQIPDLAITSVQVVNSIEDRDILAATAGALQVGDVVKTINENKVFMVQSIINGVFNWIEINADVQDLSDYARKSQSNTFTAENIFKNETGNEILSIQQGNDVIAQFLNNEKILNLFNFSVGKNPLNDNDKGFSEFYGEADFLTTKLSVGTLKDGPSSNISPIEIYYDGKIRLNSFSSIKKKVSDSSLPIADQYLISVNTNQQTTEHAYIIKVGQDQPQENLFFNYLKHDGNTQTFKIAKDPTPASSDQSLATTNWVQNLVANSGGNINTSNFAKLNTNNIYDTNVTNHFKGLIKSDRIIQLNDADQAYIKRQHLGSEINYTPLLYVEEDSLNNIYPDKRTILISIERENGANTNVDGFPAQIYWSEDPNIGPNDISWKLSHTPHTSSNDFSIATTQWVLEKLNLISGESLDPLIKDNIRINQQLKFKDIIGPSIVLNYDTTTLESANLPNPVKNAIIQVYRGSNGTAAELKWNEETDVWQLSPEPLESSNDSSIATTSWTNQKINSIALDNLTDVSLSDLTDNKVLKFNSTSSQWNATQLSSSNLSNDSLIAKKNIDNNFTAVQRSVTPVSGASTTELVTAAWVRNILQELNANPISNLDSLTDVVITSPQANQFLKFSNNQWINSLINVSDINGLNLSTYAPINSPSFTGSPSLAANATALPADDNSNRLVSSAWVKALISANISFNGILNDTNLVFNTSDNNHEGIIWNTFSANCIIPKEKVKSKTTLLNTAFKPNDEYYESLISFNNVENSDNSGRVRPGFPHIKHEVPQSGNFSHNIFINGNTTTVNNQNSGDQLRSMYTVTYLNNSGNIDAGSQIQLRDSSFPILTNFNFINPFSKDFFLLSNNCFISNGTFEGQKLFVKNVSSLEIRLGINACDETFPDNGWIDEYENIRKYYTLPSKASIEFIWLSFYKVGFNAGGSRLYSGVWYPKTVNGNVTSIDQTGIIYDQNNVQIQWPANLSDYANRFFPSSNNPKKNLT